jgi:hypothetical protein
VTESKVATSQRSSPYLPDHGEHFHYLTFLFWGNNCGFFMTCLISFAARGEGPRANEHSGEVCKPTCTAEEENLY